MELRVEPMLNSVCFQIVQEYVLLVAYFSRFASASTPNQNEMPAIISSSQLEYVTFFIRFPAPCD
jgi:hypothetical protein